MPAGAPARSMPAVVLGAREVARVTAIVVTENVLQVQRLAVLAWATERLE